METYIKIQLTAEQIAQMDTQTMNMGAIDPLSAPFGARPIQVDVLDTNGNPTGVGYFNYGVSNDVFQLILVSNQPINNQSAKPIQEETHQIDNETQLNGWRGYVGENRRERNSNTTYANRNRSGQFRGDTRNINVGNIYGRNLK
jgi:hypothetical protein